MHLMVRVSFTGETPHPPEAGDLGALLSYRPSVLAGRACGAAWAVAHPEAAPPSLIAWHDPERRRLVVVAGQILDRTRLGKADEDLARTLLDAWDADPDGWPARLSGGCMAVLWDGAAGRLSVARDRFGAQPVYWRRTAHGVAVAGSGRALLNEGPRPGPNRAMLAGYLLEDIMTTRGFAGEATYFEDIHRVPSGHVVTFDATGKTAKAYFSLASLFAQNKMTDPDPAAYRDLLRRVVNDQLSAATRACTLSGGLDSPAIARLLGDGTDESNPVATISLAPLGQGVDETAHVRAVIADMPARPIWVDIKQEDMFALFGDATRALECPMFSASPPVFLLLKRAAAAEGLHEVFGGLGADEVLGGLNLGYLADLFRQGRWLRFREELAAYQREDSLRLALPVHRLLRERVFGWPPPLRARTPDWVRSDLVGDLLEPRTAGRMPSPPPGLSAFDGRTAVLLGATFTQAFLHYETHFGITCGIENRFPYLDSRIVDYAARLPWHERMSQGIYKVHHRRAFKGIIPEVVAAQTKKTLIPAVHDHWLTTQHREAVRDIIEQDGRWTEYLDRDTVRAEYRRYMDAPDYPTRNHHRRPVWRAVSLDLFLRAFWP